MKKQYQFYSPEDWKNEDKRFWIRYILSGIGAAVLFFLLLIAMGWVSAHGHEIDKYLK